MTPEQLVLLIEKAGDRELDRARAAFDAQVEAVRVGYIIANDKRALAKWRGRSRHQATGERSRALSGAALEAAILSLARTSPEYVVFGEG